MTKTVSLNEYAYSVVAVLAGKLTILAGKPISMGMAIHMATFLLDYIVTIPQMQQKFKEILSTAQSPEDYEVWMEGFYKSITGSV